MAPGQREHEHERVTTGRVNPLKPRGENGGEKVRFPIIATREDLKVLEYAQTKDFIDQGQKIDSLKAKAERLHCRINDLEKFAANHRHAKYTRKKEAVKSQKK